MFNNSNIQSLLRSALKIGGTVIVAFGIANAGQADVLVTAAEAALGAVITLAGLVMSLWEHTPDAVPNTTPGPPAA